MSKNGLHRHYDRLTGEERFRLDVLAMARGDMQESERLLNSCPRATYTMTEIGFSGRWSGARDITLRVAVMLAEHTAKLQVLDAMREMVPYQQTLSSNIAFDAYFTGHKSGSRHAWAHAGQTGGPPAWPEGEDPDEIWEPDEDEQDPAIERDTDELEATVEEYGAFLPEVLDELERSVVSRAFGVWAGYAAFCEESMGVGGGKALAACLEPLVESVEGLTARDARLEVEADEGTVEEVREALAEAWGVAESRGI